MKKTKQFKMLLAALLIAVSGSVFAQAKIGSNPTVIESTSNLEVEASTGSRKVKVDKTTGQVTIKDGTEGVEKILTSDANGGASWKAPGEIKIDQTVFVGKQTAGAYTVTNFSGTYDDLKDRIPMTSQLGSLPGYDATTKTYTIQESGNYRVFTGAKLVGTSTVASTTQATVRLAPWQVINTYSNITIGLGPVLPLFWEAYIPAGTKVFLYVTSYTPSGAAQNITVTQGFMTIVKLAY